MTHHLHIYVYIYVYTNDLHLYLYIRIKIANQNIEIIKEMLESTDLENLSNLECSTLRKDVSEMKYEFL